MCEYDFPEYWCQTITIYHKTYTQVNGRRVPSWSCCVVENCFVGDVKRGTMQGMHDDREVERFVRIPLKVCNIAVGDVIAFGTYNAEFDPSTVAEDIRKNVDGILVRSVKNNTYAPVLKHFYASGV